jgi:E3 ubiquitin-protein transferase RMND5
VRSWARARRAELTQIGSSLEFRFHRLQFIDLIVNQKQEEALAYARTHFAQFAPAQMAEIQHLMGSFVYAKRLSKSPYAALFHPNNMPTLWDGISKIYK